MALRFEFFPEGALSRVPRPKIPIQLSGPARGVPNILALLDSGADVSVVPRKLARILGLDLSGKVTTIGGVGGRMKVTPSMVDIVISDGVESIGLSTVPVYVPLGQFQMVILGRRGVFKHLRILIDEDANLITLTSSTGRTL